MVQKLPRFTTTASAAVAVLTMMLMVLAIPLGFSINPSKSAVHTVVIALGVAVTIAVAVVVLNVGKVPPVNTAALVCILPVANILVGASDAAWIPNESATTAVLCE